MLTMSFLKVKKSKRKHPGRPLGTVLKKPEKKSVIPVRISQELYDYIEPELKKHETYADTILRLLKESRWGHIHESKKVRALEEALSSVPGSEPYFQIANDRYLSYLQSPAK